MRRLIKVALPLLFGCALGEITLAQVPMQVGRVEVEYVNDGGTNVYTFGPNAQGLYTTIPAADLATARSAFSGVGGIIHYETGSNDVRADTISSGTSGTVQGGQCSSDAAAVRTTVQHVRAPPAPKIDNVRIDPAPEPKVWWPLPRSWGALVGAGVSVFIWAIIRVVMAVREPEPYVPKRRRKAKAA